MLEKRGSIKKIVEIYANLVKNGLKKISDIPIHFKGKNLRDMVKNLLISWGLEELAKEDEE